MSQLVKKGGDTFIGLLPEEQEYLDWVFTTKGTDSPEYKQFKQAMINKYGNRVEASLQLPEIVIEAKHPEKTIKEKAKETWNNMSTETKVDLALTGAGFIPGLDVAADVIDVGRELYKGNWGNALIAGGIALIPGLSYAAYKGAKAAAKARRNNKVAKEVRYAINKRIWQDNRNIETYGFHPRRIIMGKPQGLPEPDPDTFYHSGDFVHRGRWRLRGGYVHAKDGQIQPLASSIGEPRIWWNKGDNYGNGEIILTTKSPKVDERVIDNLDKYSEYHGAYSPTYYTSGSIPIEDVQIYRRNPLTGDYEHGIKYTPVVSKADGNTYTDFYGAAKRLEEEQALAAKIAENNRLLDLLDEFSQKHAIKDLIAGTDGWEDVVLTYPKADRTTVTSNRRTNKQIRDAIARHNTFARGVQMPSSPEDIEHIRSVFGDDWMDKQDEVLKYIATHQRPGTGGFFIAPTGNAAMYGNERNGLGRVNLIRRKYKLGKDRSKWFDEGDFVFQQHPIYSGITFNETSDIIAPWLNPNTWSSPGSRVIPYRETELISPKDMHWVKFVKADTDFDALTSFNTQFNWNKYKSGGRLIPKHAKGSPVNNNPLPKMPINTNPVPEAKPKKRKKIIAKTYTRFYNLA